MSELFANGGVSSLNGGINNSVTSVVVNSASTFPTTGNFRIVVDTEIMLVTAVSGNTFTVTRGQEGTSAASHSTSTIVAMVLTKGSMETVRQEMHNYGAYASRPAATKDGKIYWPNDSTYLGRDNGSTFDQFNPVNRVVKPPAVASFTWLNQNNALASDTNAGIYMRATASAATEDFNGLEIVAPATPFTVTAGWIPGLTADNYSGLGIYFRASGSGAIEPNQLLSISAQYLFDVRRMTSPTVFSTDSSMIAAYPMSPVWFKITDNGTSRLHYYSFDGLTWNNYFTVGRTTFLTANRIGFFVWNISQVPRGTLFHWEVT